ncbi:hypothetical protein [Nitrososphaera sp.]|uniref:hypothetical protein n=1 Tax=Nitrososphaera sp. TaxID=1971748 RepID=UPI00307E7551
MADKVTTTEEEATAVQLAARCYRCDILLEGRGQFVGHMIHGHDMTIEQAETSWNSTRHYAQKACMPRPS